MLRFKIVAGFNLHAEKGKPGQYVGKVDANSPAELAGLREGDRIIEVNAIDIGSETHKQVVERIKAIPNETTLLVIDPHVFHVTKNGSPVVASSPVETKEDKKMPSPVEQSKNNNNDATDSLPDKNVKTGTKDNSAVSAATTTITTTENNNTKVSNETVMISSSNNETVVDTTKTETANHHVNNHHTKMTTEKAADATTTTTTLVENNNHDKNHENNSSAANGKQHTPTEMTESKSPSNGSVLNLNMTATELRAKLLSKKKYDPKNDSIDLRKKYDIIEKM